MDKLFKGLMNMRNLKIEPVRVAQRIIKILNCYNFDQVSLSIDEIVQMTGLAKATVYRLLWTLEKENLIIYDQKENKYRLGYKFLEYGSIVLNNIDIRKEAEPILSEIHKELGHNVMLAIRQNDQIQYLLNFESPDGLQTKSYPGRRRILHYGALGTVFMAHIPLEEAKDILKRAPLEKRTPYTLIDEEKYLERLQKVRSQGYFIDVDETFVGFSAIAFPVFGNNREVIAVIGIAGPSFQMENEKRDYILKVMKNAANELSNRMGKHSRF
jgi:DNA-binding IclR family transcriptional regulator